MIVLSQDQVWTNYRLTTWVTLKNYICLCMKEDGVVQNMTLAYVTLGFDNLYHDIHASLHMYCVCVAATA